MLSFLISRLIPHGLGLGPLGRILYARKTRFFTLSHVGHSQIRARCGPADKQTVADDARLERTASPANAFCNASDATAFFCTPSNWQPCTK